MSMSLYIPHVFSNIDTTRIVNVFESNGLGKVSKVDFVSKMGSRGEYNSVYVHFDYWYDNVVAQNFQERVRNPDKEARIVYDDPWYWIVFENKGRKFVPGQPKLRIDLSFLKKNDISYDASSNETCSINDSEYQDDFVPRKLSFDETDDEFERQMDDIEALIDEDDTQLITIDGHYVQSLEQMVCELQAKLVQAQDDIKYWVEEVNYLVAESGCSNHVKNMMVDEIQCLRSRVSLLEDKQLEDRRLDDAFEYIV